MGQDEDIFLTGVKLKFFFQRTIGESDVEIKHLPVHWRFMLVGSPTYNSCNFIAGSQGLRIGECVAGDLSCLNPSIGIARENYGNGGGILLNCFRKTREVKVLRDMHGSLSDSYKSGYEIDVWIPVKRLLRKDGKCLGEWDYNYYLCVMLELGGIGNILTSGYGYAGFQGSVRIYYK